LTGGDACELKAALKSSCISVALGFEYGLTFGGKRQIVLIAGAALRHQYSWSDSQLFVIIGKRNAK
jgi:hypothetical protein